MMNIMLDLETLGTRPNAPIIAIGAVEFDLKTATIGESFYEVIDFKSAVATGGVIDPDTVLWWMQQSDDAREAFKREGDDIANVLMRFQDWLFNRTGDIGVVNVWGNGAAFDNALLAEAYQRCGYKVPWKFWNDRCYRTVKSMYPAIKMVKTGTAHNALDDARSQAAHLLAIYKGDQRWIG